MILMILKQLRPTPRRRPLVSTALRSLFSLMDMTLRLLQPLKVCSRNLLKVNLVNYGDITQNWFRCAVINSSDPGEIGHVTVKVVFHINSVEMNEAKQV